MKALQVSHLTTTPPNHLQVPQNMAAQPIGLMPRRSGALVENLSQKFATGYDRVADYVPCEIDTEDAIRVRMGETFHQCVLATNSFTFGYIFYDYFVLFRYIALWRTSQASHSLLLLLQKLKFGFAHHIEHQNLPLIPGMFLNHKLIGIL